MIMLAQIGVRAQLLPLIRTIFMLLQLLVLARVIFSWIPVSRYHPLVRLVYDLTEPMLRPFRTMVAAGKGGVDFSPLILLIVLWVAEQVIVRVIVG